MLASALGAGPTASATPPPSVRVAGVNRAQPAVEVADANDAGTAGDAATVPQVTPVADRAVVTLDTLNPTVVAPGDAVTITGTVTAPTTGPLTSPRVRLVQGAPVTKRDQIDTWASGADPASGPQLGSVSLPSVLASATAEFTLRLPSGAVHSNKAFAALPVSVEVVQQSASEPVGIARTFLAWNARKEYDKLQIATVLPITLDPDVELFSRVAEVRDRAWQSAIGPDSRIRRIIDGAANSSITLAVDPSVFGPEAIDPVTPAPSGPDDPQSTTPPNTTPTNTSPDVADPGQPTTPSSDSPTGPPSTTPAEPSATPTDSDVEGADVRALSAGLVRSLAGRSLWALPYADADLAATVDIAPTNPLVRDLVDRASLVAKVVGHPVRSDIIWPVDGRMPARREVNLRTMLAGTTVKKAAGVIVNQQSITGASPYTPTARRVATGGTRLLGYDPRLSALLPNRSGPSAASGTAVALPVQRYLAETLVILGERSGTPRSLLVVAPRTYDPDAAGLAAFVAATSTAPWLTPIDAASLLTDSGADRALKQQQPVSTFPATVPPPTLNRRRLALMEFQRERLNRVAGVLRDGEQFQRTYREVLDELASVRWRYQPASWSQLSTTVAAETRAATSAIKVVAQSVNFLAEKGTLQITVENGLPYQVEDIRLVLAPSNPRMQVVTQPGPISIAPSSKRVVPVPVIAVAAGEADIRAFLTTADGTPIGSPAVIPVSANPIDSTVFWVGGGLLGLILLAGVARAVVKGTSRIDEISDTGALPGRHGRDVHEKSP
ncbi:MAG: DUF6049 family protein [Humibacillus sp.]|nr:DUF6049 family protein [Humibacillus sp.]MDN5777796.1 DUF6049 family protein [Humibacillus sp.]